MIRAICVVAFVASAFIFVVKLVWVFGIPYHLVAAWKPEEDSSPGTSCLLPFIEFVALLACVGCSFGTAWSWPWTPGGIALFGAIAILASYLHFAAVGAVYGLLHPQKKKP